MKNSKRILVLAILTVFVLVLVPIRQSYAGTCLLTGASWSAGSATTNMRALKSGDKVNLNVSGAPNSGAPQGCKDFQVNFRIQKCTITASGPDVTTTCTQNIASLNGTFDSAGQNAIATWTVDTTGLTGSNAELVFTAVAGDQTIQSASVVVSTGSSGVQIYGCKYKDNSGSLIYGCTATPSDSKSNCSNIPFNCEPNTCQLIDRTNCGQPVGSATTHKVCQNNACVIVNGAGSDTCTTNPNSCAGGGSGGGTTTQNFNLPNPIGINTFEELVNVIGTWIFNLAIPIAVIIIIYAGVLMLTSGGDPGRFKKGAEALKWAVIGLAVVLIGKGFVSLIKSILSLKG